ncbi:MAG: hypothetical protein P8I29_07445 [Flavobacteriales bacterium]|jgi:hypothetical protein|nr:hypothetical protein [Flavobacteriales bacterium]MDG1917624.1 hypothetical protein [Flavobacteriales bacterium]|tara:strand:+ start:5963 stop:6457 length:495 start_codon:yes stop_codon:yes gene_type:complete
MTVKLNIVLDHNDDVFREIRINTDNTLEDLHKVIVSSFGLKPEEMAAFYLTNEEWEQGEEIPLIAMEPSSREMQNISVNDIFQNTEKLLYVNDFLILWRFMIEVEEIDELKEVEEAEVVLSFGNMPEEAPMVQFISDEDNLTEEEDIFGDALDEFNEFENYEGY